MTGDRTSALPASELLAALDDDAQGWAVGQAVRVDGRIVDFQLVYLNDAGARILGRPRAELIGRGYREMWPETMHDGTLPLYAEVVRSRRATTRTVYYDRATITGHFEIRIAPCGDGFAARFVDLAKVTLQPMSAAGPLLYDVLDAAFDGFILLRAEYDGNDDRITDYTCEYVNQVGAKLSGRSAEDLVGRRVRDFSPRGVQAGLLDRCVEVSGSGAAWLAELPDPAGELVWELKISRIDQRYIAVTYRDVTERVRQQERIARGEMEARQAAERNAAMQAVTAALAAASTPAEVYAVMAAQVRPSAGGQGVLVSVRDEGRVMLRYHASYDPVVVEQVRELPLHAPSPLAVTVRTGAAHFYRTPEELAGAWPEIADLVRAGDRGSWAFLPLATAGRVIGAMVVGYRERRAFDVAERDTLAAFSGLCAQALQRALLFEAQRSIAADLQRALLPAVLPELRGARHAVRYLPWTHGAEVGGDWYDVIPLGQDAVAVVIGDVAGHSPNAAATMGQIRNALRAYAAEGHSPTGVLERVNRLMLRVDPEAVATCCYLEVHLAEGTATAVLAGHPPPVLYTGGFARPLVLRGGPPLGVQLDAAYVDSTFLLPGGSTLVLYTDGLVEDRRYDMDRGVADLCAAVARAPSSEPEAVVDHILTADVGPYPRSDDVAILALTVDAALPPGPPWAQRRFGGDAASAPAARRFAADILTSWGQAALIDNARLLLGEIITNAVQHTVGDVQVQLTLGDDRLRVEVRDRSDRQPDRRPVGDDSESGRGLHIVEVLARAWGYEPQPTGGKVVWFELDRERG